MIPKKVKVAGINYEVIEKDFIEIDGGRNYQGSCRERESQIELLNTLSDEKKEQVFIHELTHAILFECGYREHNEEIVDRFSIILHQVLKDNGKMIE